jgi:uncharacterized protein YjbJ (UPF0337 family)
LGTESSKNVGKLSLRPLLLRVAASLSRGVRTGAGESGNAFRALAQRLRFVPSPIPRQTEHCYEKEFLTMVNQQTLRGNWNEIKGKIRSKWGQLTGDDLQAFDGNVDQLVGMIQRKTGEARGAVEHYLEELTTNGASAFNQAAESVREYAHQAAGAVQETSKKAAETMRHGYDEAEKMIRDRPGESAAVCFGVGMVVGVLLGLTLRAR